MDLKRTFALALFSSISLFTISCGSTDTSPKQDNPTVEIGNLPPPSSAEKQAAISTHASKTTFPTEISSGNMNSNQLPTSATMENQTAKQNSQMASTQEKNDGQVAAQSQDMTSKDSINTQSTMKPVEQTNNNSTMQSSLKINTSNTANPTQTLQTSSQMKPATSLATNSSMSSLGITQQQTMQPIASPIQQETGSSSKGVNNQALGLPMVASKTLGISGVVDLYGEAHKSYIGFLNKSAQVISDDEVIASWNKNQAANSLNGFLQFVKEMDPEVKKEFTNDPKSLSSLNLKAHKDLQEALSKKDLLIIKEIFKDDLIHLTSSATFLRERILAAAGFYGIKLEKLTYADLKSGFATSVTDKIAEKFKDDPSFVASQTLLPLHEKLSELLVSVSFATQDKGVRSSILSLINFEETTMDTPLAYGILNPSEAVFIKSSL